MRRLLFLAVLTAGLVMAMATAALAADVTITDDGLEPAEIEVEVREPIVWTNNTDGDVSLMGEEPAWESGTIEPGATFSIEITRPGTYNYTSEDGTTLEGTIVVVEAEDGGNGEGEGDGESDASEDEEGDEPDEAATEEPDETVDPDDEALPMTGISAAVPGALSLLLMSFGGGLLAVTERPRRRRG